MAENENDEPRSLAVTPTWSVAVVLTVFVLLSLLIERSIYLLCKWLGKTKRKPLFEAVEKMKEELMLLGFISLMLSATSSSISSICIESKYYNTRFSPCTISAAEEDHEDAGDRERSFESQAIGNCKRGYEPFVSVEGLEQLQRFIFIMAITHVLYSCITMLLALLKNRGRDSRWSFQHTLLYIIVDRGGGIPSSAFIYVHAYSVNPTLSGDVRIYTWRGWECEARTDMDNTLTAITKELTIKRQSTFVYSYNTGVWSRSNILVWLTSFFRQFGKSVTRTDYLTLRRGFITNHNLLSSYDFHSYMIRCMEEEFKRIVGISAPLWAVVIAFMLLNVNGSNLYFWVSIVPVILLLLLGAKLQHVIATLAIENAGIHDSFEGVTLRPRDELFWLNKPELLLLMIHFILFENAFELASFVWFWWQFGYDSCFLRNHLLVYIRLILGFAGQFLCSYSTLPLYALVTQMGTHYKAALIPPRVRETIDVWGKAAKRRRKHGAVTDDFSLRSSDNSISVCKNHDSNHFEGCNVSQTHVQVDSNSPEPTFTDEQNK